MTSLLRRAVLLLLLPWLSAAQAGEAKIAVAANFTAAAREIAAAFAQETGHTALLSFGSTGKLYAQIAHGAPFEVLLAADEARPARAEAEGLAVPGSRFTYAVGRLVLYSPDPARLDPAGGVRAALLTGGKLAIANPKTAPYGAAAVQTLQALGLYQQVRPRLVLGENIAQAHQFVLTGNAPLGFVALSQVIGAQGGSRWLVPASLHAPIRQDAVLLQRGAGSQAARVFLDYLRGERAGAILRRYGYGSE